MDMPDDRQHKTYQDLPLSVRRLGLASHVVFWMFVVAFAFDLSPTLELGAFVLWVLMRTAWYQLMCRAGAEGVSWSEAVGAFVFCSAACFLLAVPLGVPADAVTIVTAKWTCVVTAAYVIVRGVHRGLRNARADAAVDTDSTS